MRTPSTIGMVALVALACGGGAERRPAESRDEVQPAGWHRARTGESTVPLSRPAGAAEVPPAEAFERATGSSTDTTGVLLAREFDPAGPDLVHHYYLYLPPGIDSQDDWPLILWLHGRSLRGDDLARVARYGIPARLAREADLPFVVVAPQLPDGQSWTDTGRLAALVEDVADRYPIDDDRIYLVGYSMGAGGVWRLVVDHPDLFAAVAPAAAWTPAPSAAIAEALEDVPVRIDHGTADEAAPFARAKAMAEYLEAAGVDVTFEVHPGANHGELTRIYKGDDFFAWLLRHERD